MKRIQIFLIALAGYILRALGYRPVAIWLPDRIGHLVAEVDMILKEHAITGDTRRTLFVFSRKRLANKAVLACWKRTISVIVWDRLYEFIRANKDSLPTWEVVSLEDQRYGRACSNYSSHPVMKLTKVDHLHGEILLRQLGIKSDCWYVCFHNREAGYLPNLEYHSYRDASISTLHKAMQWIVDQGGIAIRMGDPTMTPLPPMEGVVDYAHSEHREPFLDLYLCATCRFIVGCSSGLFCVSGVFHRPVACVNMAPMGSIPFYPDSLFIPMLVREVETSRILSFEEVLSGKSGNFWLQEEFDALGLETVPNDADDILDLTREVFNATAYGLLPPDRLQQQFKRLLRTEHTGYWTKAVIGAAFIRKYEHLFQKR